MLAGGSIFSYGGDFGFMGLFIMRADLRKKGLGTVLWHRRRDHPIRRLKPGAAIGMDGVFDMVPFYERGSIKSAFRDVRYQGAALGRNDAGVIELGRTDFAEIAAYDCAFVPTSREAFLARWISAPGVMRENGKLAGYGVARPEVQ